MKRLKMLRLEHKLTQAYMARCLGITPQQYQRYESGKSYPRLEDASKLADFFNVTLDYLLDRTDNPGTEMFNFYQLNDTNQQIVSSLIQQLLDSQSK